MKLASAIPSLGLLAGAALAAYGATFARADVGWALKLAASGALVAGASGLLLRARDEVRANASLVVVSLAFGLYAVELFLALRPPEGPPPGFDARTEMEVVRATPGSVPALVPSHLIGGGHELLPLGGIATATTVFCNESGSWVRYGSDEHGFNNPRGLPERAEVVVIGDSFAHGRCVAQGEDLAGRLREMGHAAVNLGTSGSGPLVELATLIEHGLPRRPKLVLWLYFENDRGDLVREARDPLLLRYLEPGFTQHLASRQPEVDAFWRRWLATWKPPERAPRPGFLRIAKLEHLRALLGLRRASQGSLRKELEAVLSRARDEIRGAGAELVIVQLPGWSRGAAPDADLTAAATALGLRVIDLGPVIAASDPERLYPPRRPSHFNAAGYARIAEALAAQLF